MRRTQVSVGVDEKRPTLISSLFDEEIPEGNRQPRLRFCVSFEVRVEKGQFRILPSAVHQDDLGGWIIPEILVHLTQCEIAATEQDGETVVFGPSIDGACPGSDHPLRIRDNDELLALEGFSFSMNHCSIMLFALMRSASQPAVGPEYS